MYIISVDHGRNSFGVWTVNYGENWDCESCKHNKSTQSSLFLILFIFKCEWILKFIKWYYNHPSWRILQGTSRLSKYWKYIIRHECLLQKRFNYFTINFCRYFKDLKTELKQERAPLRFVYHLSVGVSSKDVFEP